MRVLVTGATGFIGSRLVPSLLDAGHEVYALTREAARYDGPSAVRVVEGNILNAESYAPVLADIDAVYYLIHSMGTTDSDFAERDRKAARTFVEAAAGNGIERVIYLGGLGKEDDGLSKHLRSRREVEEVLTEGEYELTSLRAAIVIGNGSQSFEIIHQLVDRLPLLVTPQSIDTECQPIAVGDVVAYLTGVLDVPETSGLVLEIGGPDVLTYREMLTRTAEVLDRKPLVVAVPLLTLGLAAYCVDLVTSVPSSVAHPLTLGLGNRVVVENDRIEQYVSFERTPFEEAVRKALEDAASKSEIAPRAGK